MSGFVYAMRAGEFVKFGWAKDVEARKLQLQTGCPQVIQVIAAVQWPRKYERAIHAKLSASRSSGEWFHDCDGAAEVVAMMQRCDAAGLDEFVGVKPERAEQVPMVSQAFYLKMLELDLPRNVRRTLDAMIAASKRGTVKASQVEIASRVGIAAPHVSAAISRLCAENILSRSGRGRYAFSPGLIK